MPSSPPSPSGSRSPSSDHPQSHHHEDDPRSGPSSSSSSSSSSSEPGKGTTRPHHLLPPLTPPTPLSGSGSGSGDKPGGPIFANEILDPELLGHSNPHGHSTVGRSPVPEKCLTFCTQSQDRQPLCRMFCLRRRRPLASQKEELARLRPDAAIPQGVGLGSGSGSGSGTSTDTRHSGRGRAEGQETWRWWNWNPFQAMEKQAAPYSFIYVKGSPEGVVGRYMEEMEGDDGNTDFGSISRGAGDLARKRGAGGWEYLDWGEHGSLLHLPFTSLFYPIISFPQTLERVFAPSIRLLNLYRASFNEGSQTRNLAKIRTEVETGGAFKLFDKLETHYRKKIGERKAEVEKQIQERARQKEEMVMQKRKEEEVGKGAERDEARKSIDELERIKRSS